MELHESENTSKNGTTRKARTREVTSRYMSPARCLSPTLKAPKRCPSPTPNALKRYPSPNASRASSSSSTLPLPKRAVSTERRRPTTPITDTDAESILAPNKMVGSKLPDSLWPSTMRSLDNSFQSNKSEKTRPIVCAVEARKPTPERKRSPLKGKNSLHLSENAKPADILRHQWPGRKSETTDATLDKTSRISSLSRARMASTATPPLRRLSLDGMTMKYTQKSHDESLARVDDQWLRAQRPSSSSSDRTRSVSLSRPSSPPALRGISPSRARVVSCSSRGNNPQSSGSVLSFIADMKKGKKGESNVEDAHRLKLMYNRHLQWRFTNARAVAVLRAQKAKTEKTLYSVWRLVIDLWRLVTEKRSDVQQLKLKLKLYSVFHSQVIFLEEWSSLEKNHTNSLTGAIQDLEAGTLRIPVTGGARVDIRTLKEAVCSAVDVMSSMGSSLRSVLPKVEGINRLVVELASLAARQRAMLDECESLLSSIAELQVVEDSLKTHILQMTQTMNDS